MTTPRSDTNAAISRPKHGAPAEETQAIPRQAPATVGGPTAATAPAAAAPAVGASSAGASSSGASPAAARPPARTTPPPVPVPGAPVPPTRPAAGAPPAARSGTPTAAGSRPDLQKPSGADAPPDLQKPPSDKPRPAAGAAPTRSGAPIPTRPPAPARRAPSRGPRRARLQLRHIDPWSALKFSLVVSIALFFVWMVAVGVLYGVLNGLDVFSQVNSLWADLQGSSGEDIVTPTLVFGGAAVIGAINILLFTALATVGAFIYNLCADLVGGLEITLGERD